MERIIKLNLDLEKISADGPSLVDIQNAVGRLALWGGDTFPHLLIKNDGQNDLIAYYHNNSESRHFSIGAVWRSNSKEYTFHS